MRKILTSRRGVRSRRTSRSCAVTLLVMLSLMGGAGCGSDPTKPRPHIDPSELFWSLDVDRKAVILSTTAPYDTLTVVATPRNYHGDALSGLPAPQFTSTDPFIMSVSANGTLAALRPGPVSIVATVTTNDLTHADTVSAIVVDEPAPVPLGNLSIHPMPPDSAKWSVGGRLIIDKWLRLTTSDGQPYPDAAQIPFEMRIADTTIAAGPATYKPVTRNFEIVGKKIGAVDISVRTTAFGITKGDTLSVRLGWPLLARLEVYPVPGKAGVNYFAQPVLKVGVGALVAFFDRSPGVPTDIVFDDPASVQSFNSIVWQDGLVAGLKSGCNGVFGVFPSCDDTGNVLLDGAAEGVEVLVGSALRTFNAAGVYNYQSVTHGINGTIIVVDESVGSP